MSAELPQSYPMGDRFRCPCGGWVVAVSIGDGELREQYGLPRFWARCSSRSCDRVPDGVVGRTKRRALDAYWLALRSR